MITKISDHKERLKEMLGNMGPGSEFLASLCLLVDTNSIAPKRENSVTARTWGPAL